MSQSPDAVAAHDPDQLQRTLTGGAQWFYWIAALSLVNSTIMFFGGAWNFVVGLGATQVVDAFAAMVAEAASDAATAAKLVALTGDVMIAGVFALFGYLAVRRHSWAFIIGMLLYTLDGLLFLLVSDWLSLGFHAFALVCIYSGFSAGRKLDELERSSGSGQRAVRSDPITP